MVTIREVAAECGVSVATVSNVINGRVNVSTETRERVLDAVRRTGYQPDYVARGLRKKKTNMIGIIAEDICQFSTPAIMEGIMRYCEQKKYRTVIQNLRLYARWGEFWYEKDDAYRAILDPAIQEMVSIKADGLIYVAGHARVVRYFNQALEIPTVVAHSYTHATYTPVVVVDDEKAACEMTRYLISMGHHKIGILAGKADNIHTGSRLRGHQRALFEENILYNPGWVRYGDWDRTSGYRFAGQLLEEGVTAIFCMNDWMAGGVYDYFREHGIRVGEDISVTGFDNQEISQYCSPGLTTMELPLTAIGAEAAAILLGRLESDKESLPNAAFERSIPCRLIERESVKRLTV